MEVALEEAIQSLGEPPQEVVSTEDVHVKTECFICQKAIDSVQDSFELLQCETETSKTKLVEKMGQIVDQADVVIVVAEADTICRQCFGLLNTIDKLEGGLEKLKEEVRVHIVPRYKVQVPKPEPEEVEIRSGKKRVKRESGRATRNSPAKKTKNIRVAIKTATAKGKGAKQTNEPSVTITEEEIVEEEEDHAVETSTTEDPQPGPSTSTESTNAGSQTPKRQSVKVETPIYNMLKKVYPDKELSDAGVRRQAISKLLERGRKSRRAVKKKVPAEDLENAKTKPQPVSSFQCETCGKCFRNSRSLNQHMQRERGATYKCKHCGETFDTQARCRKHEWEHVGIKGHVCEVCGKLFQSKTGLINHLAWHRGEQKFQCEVCGRGFSQRMNYMSHCAIHTGEKSFECSLCHEHFRHYGSLWSHKILVHGQAKKSYSCDICDKVYHLPNHLAAHRKSHLDVKPYSCDLCRKRFTRATSLKLHMSTHTNRYAYNCRLCSFHSNRKYRAAKHLKNAHGVDDSVFDTLVDVSRLNMKEIRESLNAEEQPANVESQEMESGLPMEAGQPVALADGSLPEHNILETHQLFETSAVMLDEHGNATKIEIREAPVIHTVHTMEVVQAEINSLIYHG